MFTARSRAAFRIRWSHIDPRPISLSIMENRLKDVVIAYDLPEGRVVFGIPIIGNDVAVGWKSPRGDVIVRESWSRNAPRDIAAKVERILYLEETGKLRPARRTPAIREDTK